MEDTKYIIQSQDITNINQNLIREAAALMPTYSRLSKFSVAEGVQLLQYGMAHNMRAPQSVQELLGQIRNTVDTSIEQTSIMYLEQGINITRGEEKRALISKLANKVPDILREGFKSFFPVFENGVFEGFFKGKNKGFLNIDKTSSHTIANAWTDANGAQIIKDISAMAEKLRVSGYLQNYLLILPDTYSHIFASEYSAVKGDKTILDSIKNLPFISNVVFTNAKSMAVEDTAANTRAVLIKQDPTFISVAVGLPLLLKDITTQREIELNYLLATRLAIVIKQNTQNKRPICVAKTAGLN